LDNFIKIDNLFEIGDKEKINFGINIAITFVFFAVIMLVFYDSKFDPKNRKEVLKHYSTFLFVNLALLTYDIYLDILNQRSIINSIINFFGKISLIFIFLLIANQVNRKIY